MTNLAVGMFIWHTDSSLVNYRWINPHFYLMLQCALKMNLYLNYAKINKLFFCLVGLSPQLHMFVSINIYNSFEVILS